MNKPLSIDEWQHVSIGGIYLYLWNNAIVVGHHPDIMDSVWANDKAGVFGNERWKTSTPILQAGGDYKTVDWLLVAEHEDTLTWSNGNCDLQGTKDGSAGAEVVMAWLTLTKATGVWRLTGSDESPFASAYKIKSTSPKWKAICF